MVGNILIIEDNETMREGLKHIVTKMGYKAFAVSNGNEGILLFSENKIDFVISDLKMENLDGIETMEKILKIDPDALVMIITGYGTIETAVSAMKKGAYDFITKPFSPDVIRLKITNGLNYARLRKENIKLASVADYFVEKEAGEYNFGEIIGKSQVVKEIMERVQKVAPTDSSVLITGESGTGKELVARAIHFNSTRKDRPFIKVNCGSLSEGILESELFGHEKGSFTGALKRKPGRFELADKGTIFLDEIGDFTPMIQLKLLRVLQEREFERVGGTETLKIDVRIISATNKDLQKEMKRGAFREDLFYRLHIVPIYIPALRERRDDIRELVNHFVNKLNLRSKRKVSGFSDEAMKLLLNYPWPGNVRELENVVEQSYVLSGKDMIEPSDLPPVFSEINTNNYFKIPQDGLNLNDSLENLERQLIERAYKKAKGVKAETARLLGIKTSALYYKLEKYGFITREEAESIPEEL